MLSIGIDYEPWLNPVVTSLFFLFFFFLPRHNRNGTCNEAKICFLRLILPTGQFLSVKGKRTNRDAHTKAGQLSMGNFYHSTNHQNFSHHTCTDVKTMICHIWYGKLHSLRNEKKDYTYYFGFCIVKYHL